MSVVQLRRYQLAEGTLSDWVSHWREDVVPLRQNYGFRILFAYADHVNSQFVWAVSFDGTAEELATWDREYHSSPEWEARNGGRTSPFWARPSPSPRRYGHQVRSRPLQRRLGLEPLVRPWKISSHKTQH